MLDYRIDRQPARVDAVGLITARTTTVFRFATLKFYGVDANGRVVSQARDVIDGTFGGPQSFSLGLKPAGTEVRYKLQVGNYSLGRDP